MPERVFGRHAAKRAGDLGGAAERFVERTIVVAAKNERMPTWSASAAWSRRQACS
jgi:hypothetical protein